MVCVCLFVFLYVQTCVLNKSRSAYAVIFCMEAAADVVKSAESVSVHYH